MKASLEVPLEGVFSSKGQSTFGTLYFLLQMDRQDMSREAFFIQDPRATFPETCLTEFFFPWFHIMYVL